MRPKKKSKKFYLILAGVMLLIIIALIGINRLAKKDRAGSEDVIEEETYEGEPAEEGAQEEQLSLTFFREENLSFLSAGGLENFRQEFSQTIENGIDPESVTCCVILSNLEALSNRTYRFYVQTNAQTSNLYQVIVNEGQDFLEITSYRKEIEDIESYGGADQYDNIENIYLSGSRSEETIVEEPTLEEEQEAKAKEYEELEKAE